MKPIIFTDFEKYDGDDNLLLVEKNAFNKLVEDVYNTGVEDGKKMLYTPFTAYGNWNNDGIPSPCKTTVTSK